MEKYEQHQFQQKELPVISLLKTLKFSVWAMPNLSVITTSFLYTFLIKSAQTYLFALKLK